MFSRIGTARSALAGAQVQAASVSCRFRSVATAGVSRIFVRCSMAALRSCGLRAPGRRRHAAVAPRGDRRGRACDAPRCCSGSIFSARSADVDGFLGLVLARVEAGDLGEDLGRLRIERLRPLERLERAGRVALRLEVPRQQEFEIGLAPTPAPRRVGRVLRPDRRRTQPARQNGSKGSASHIAES